MLQKTFEIPGDGPSPYLLNIELGNAFLSLNSFDDSGQAAAGFELFNFRADDRWSDTWQGIQETSKILNPAAGQGIDFFQKIQVTWENDLVQAIPNVFWRPELMGDYARFNKGSLTNNTQLYNTTADYTFLYTVPTEYFEQVQACLPDAAHQHKYAGIVSKLGQFDSPYPLEMLLIFYQDHFIICGIKQQQLQVINTHYFDNGTAVTYHLLNAIRQLGGELSQTCVYLSGLIDGDSALYREIYKFVPVIDVDQDPAADFLSQTNTYPSHFFVPFYKYK